MIHYSDQYDAASPGFDVITTTNKRDPYIEALQQVLRETPGLGEIDPESVLTRLVAIDGELALDIQQAEETKSMELLGLVGGLAVSSELLASELPEYEWIPISLNEFARHDRQYKSDEEGLLQYFGDGKASDDLCFVGIPRNPDVDELILQLWIVETKGGTSNIKKGVEQVLGAREKLKELFDPDNAYADTNILRSEFGDVIIQIANRLYQYGVIESHRRDIVLEHADRLVDSEYEIELLEDAESRVGEVIRIQKDIHLPSINTNEGVRVLKLPTEVLSLINETNIGTNNIHPDLKTDKLSFTSPKREISETPVTANDSTITRSGSDGKETSTSTTPKGNGIDNSLSSDQTDEKSTEEEEKIESQDRADSPEKSSSKTSVQSESDSDDDTTAAGVVDNGSADSNETDERDDTEKQGYTWSRSDFDRLASILDESPEKQPRIDISRLTTNLKEQFESLGVDVHEPNPADVSIGPRKIGINVVPKPGQKIEGVMNSLESISVHIQASGAITGVSSPAEGAIRLEIPHGKPRDIYLRDGLQALADELQEPLKIPLGVTTENEHVTINLLEEHHALIGGSTGSGKSNFLATAICSLAVSYPPSLVKLSLLDPKGIDFGRFESLPQVDTYIDTAGDCVTYLETLLESELEERRNKLKEQGSSSVQEYNRLAASGDFEPIPYRVIVIDEFADLVMSLSENKDEFEDAVGRLAQIGRALGYSILLATQRPDANIVSGNIKTNFNCRISFELPSNTDSRVILDQPGAEDLEGAGDMIALTSAGDEYHLQGYRLRPEDAITIRNRLSQE
jgi:DNA segregation ATPase FtsK/SpoIIIE-like protein